MQQDSETNLNNAGSDAYPRLFSPIRLAGHTLRNRIIHASISNHFSNQHSTYDRQIQYLANRAKGGAAAIVTEPLGIAPHHPISRLRVFDDSMADYGKRWAPATEAHDCRLLGQIQDPGRGRHRPGRSSNAIGPSPDPDEISWTVPHAMTTTDIAVFIERTAEATARLIRWGFAGVELSAAHGHLFHQFMSPHTNRRLDEYGGSFENRMRFMVELCAALRSALGAHNILGVKLPGNDGVAGGVDPTLAAEIAAHLTKSVKVDYCTYAQGSHDQSLEMHIPNDSYPRVPYAQLIRNLANATPDTPVMVLGRITDPAEAEALLADGRIDLVGLGRPLVTDPAWPNKARAGRAIDIRYCLNHNSCWEIAVDQHVLLCDNNPRIGLPDELDFQVAPAHPQKKIVVVGSGVAGLEAAWTAASRGHEVVVYGASGEVGGKTRQHAHLPNSESLSSVYDFQLAEASRHNVRFELGKKADLSMILGERPGGVILATGSTMIWPDSLPLQLKDEGLVPDLREALSDLADVQARQAGCAVIIDMDHTEGVYAAAERLHSIFDEVVLLTPRERIAEDTSLTTRQTILRRVHELGIRYHVLCKPRWTDSMNEGRLEIANVYSGQISYIENVAFLSYATPRRPNDELLQPLLERGVDTIAIGDARTARQIAYATLDGYQAGMRV